MIETQGGLDLEKSKERPQLRSSPLDEDLKNGTGFWNIIKERLTTARMNPLGESATPAVVVRLAEVLMSDERNTRQDNSKWANTRKTK